MYKTSAYRHRQRRFIDLWATTQYVDLSWLHHPPQCIHPVYRSTSMYPTNNLPSLNTKLYISVINETMKVEPSKCYIRFKQKKLLLYQVDSKEN